MKLYNIFLFEYTGGPEPLEPIFLETEPVESNRLFNKRLWTEPCTTNQKLEPNRTESNRYHAVQINGCYSVGSRSSWSCLKWMLQRSIHCVLGVTWNRFYNVTLGKDVVTDCHSWKTILSRLWNYCACHAKRGGVTFAPALGSCSPLPPPWVGASATPHEVGANSTPAPKGNHPPFTL